MLPYVPYQFGVSDVARRGANRTQVEVADITAGYGPTGGWEDYGGTTRERGASALQVYRHEPAAVVARHPHFTADRPFAFALLDPAQDKGLCPS